jgi:hypothetical protein
LVRGDRTFVVRCLMPLAEEIVAANNATQQILSATPVFVIFCGLFSLFAFLRYVPRQLWA